MPVRRIRRIFFHTSTHVLAIGSSVNAPRPLQVLETRTAHSVRRNRGRAQQARPSNDRLRCSRRSSPSRAERQGSTAAPARGFQMRGRKTPRRKPVQCRSSISRCIQLHQGFPRRQEMVGSNEANSHREQEARSDQARGRWRWNIEVPASSTND
jgi:hypothetical protein